MGDRFSYRTCQSPYYVNEHQPLPGLQGMAMADHHGILVSGSISQDYGSMDYFGTYSKPLSLALQGPSTLGLNPTSSLLAFLPHTCSLHLKF